MMMTMTMMMMMMMMMMRMVVALMTIDTVEGSSFAARNLHSKRISNCLGLDKIM